MKKYIVYDNDGIIYETANSKEEIIATWNDTKMWRSIAKQIHKNKEYSMGLTEVSEEEKDC